MEYANFSLCGLKIRAMSREPLTFDNSMAPFLWDGKGEPDVVYTLEYYQEPPQPMGQQVFTQIGYYIERDGETFRYGFNVGAQLNDHRIFLEMNPHQTCYRLLLPERHRSLLSSGFRMEDLLGQELLFLRSNRLLMHASFISYRGMGISFTGPSGMGKSTQASLWEKHFDAKILNGDKSVFHLGQEIRTWGSPYAGTSGIYRNESAPTRAIVSLRQGPENTIRRLYGREALSELMPRMATVPWGGEWHVRGMDMAIELVNRVPVYLLSCRPDREAAELTRQTIFGGM